MKTNSYFYNELHELNELISCAAIRIIREIRSLKFLLCLFAVFVSCSSDDSTSSPSVTTHTYKVAVIMESGEQARWERTAERTLGVLRDCAAR